MKGNSSSRRVCSVAVNWQLYHSYSGLSPPLYEVERDKGIGFCLDVGIIVILKGTTQVTMPLYITNNQGWLKRNHIGGGSEHILPNEQK